jgi:hypothetical protein
MFDQPSEPHDDEEPIWSPSGWTPVFVDAVPGQPGAQLIGHTKLAMPAPFSRRFRLTSPCNDGIADDYLHGDMVLHPYRQGHVLIWAWHLENEGDREYIPDFWPMPTRARRPVSPLGHERSTHPRAVQGSRGKPGSSSTRA